jgi:hypothetical protein
VADVAWAPTLADVARHIPTRTRDTLTPGSDALLGTFTEATTPTAEQAQADLDSAVRAITADVGPLPTAGDPTVLAGLQAAARDAAEWRAAADIELAYPNRNADVLVARDLEHRAQVALELLRRVLGEAGAGLVWDLPDWGFPAPWVHADEVV